MYLSTSVYSENVNKHRRRPCAGQFHRGQSVEGSGSRVLWAICELTFVFLTVLIRGASSVSTLGTSFSSFGSSSSTSLSANVTGNDKLRFAQAQLQYDIIS